VCAQLPHPHTIAFKRAVKVSGNCGPRKLITVPNKGATCMFPVSFVHTRNRANLMSLQVSLSPFADRMRCRTEASLPLSKASFINRFNAFFWNSSNSVVFNSFENCRNDSIGVSTLVKIGVFECLGPFMFKVPRSQGLSFQERQDSRCQGLNKEGGWGCKGVRYACACVVGCSTCKAELLVAPPEAVIYL
jgi:hypothetical protein